MKVRFEIHFEDLTEVTQYYFCRKFKTTPDKETLKGIPLVIVSREIEEEGERDGTV